MSGLLYVKNWRRFQHYGDKRRPPWIKLYLSLLGDDEWLDLNPSDRTLLMVVWMLAASHPQGAAKGCVRHDEGWLKAQAKTPKGSVKRLIDAGFLATGASEDASDPLARRSKKENTPLTPQGGNGLRPREQRQLEERQVRRAGAVAACRRVFNQAMEDGENREAVIESLERDYRHDPTILSEAIPEARTA